LEDGVTGETFLLQLYGEIDLARAGALESHSDDFLASTAQHAVIDLSRVTFCDSQGLNFFVRLERTARDREGDVTLVNAPAAVRNLLRITSLEDRFRYEDRLAVPEQLVTGVKDFANGLARPALAPKPSWVAEA